MLRVRSAFHTPFSRYLILVFSPIFHLYLPPLSSVVSTLTPLSSSVWPSISLNYSLPACSLSEESASRWASEATTAREVCPLKPFVLLNVTLFFLLLFSLIRRTWRFHRRHAIFACSSSSLTAMNDQRMANDCALSQYSLMSARQQRLAEGAVGSLEVCEFGHSLGNEPTNTVPLIRRAERGRQR